MKKFNWTAIIPAAGKSTRFKSKKSKIFFIYKKKSILENILDKVLNLTNNVVIVVNQNDEKESSLISRKFKNKNIKIVVQKKINGMGTAIQLALRKTKTKNFFSLWGDQLGLSLKTMRSTINFFEKNEFPIVFPAVYKKNPYTIINFKNGSYLKDIKQSREIKIVVKKGYSDCGFFCCKTSVVKRSLNQSIQSKSIITQKTKEYDFLLSLNIFAKKNKIKVLKSSNIKDSIGINFKRDLNLL
jgi:bifunctional N-acetylglucosamine-1-phosphate-uridyltransferase/glucosamine-1-phosphate-acetyltransferase GlmU-like protein